MNNGSLQLLIKPAGAACNLACSYCFYRRAEELHDEDSPEIMTPEVIEALIRRSMEERKHYNSFSWQGGEPTLCGLDFFRNVVKLQEKYGSGQQSVANALQTNGIRLNAAFCEFLAHYKFLTGISVDGPENIHDSQRRRGKRGSFREADRAMLRMRRAGAEYNTLTVVSRKNQHMGAEIYRWLRNRGEKYMQFIPCVEKIPGTKLTAPFSVSPEGYADFMIEVFEEWIKEDIREVYVRDFDSAFCRIFKKNGAMCVHSEECGSYLMVEKDGSVYPCDFFGYDEWLVGNITDSSITELLNGPVMQKFREIKKNTGSRCAACPVVSICNGGCPKDRMDGIGGFADRTYLCEGNIKFFSHLQSSRKKVLEKLGLNEEQIRSAKYNV
ncbi:MAG: anaerobic sulfatase maturase [Fibrobacterota bacterium]